MAQNRTRKGTGSQEVPRHKQEAPLSLAIAKTGINTGQDFARFMSALMSDLIEGKITPGVGNAAVNAGGKLLKVVELQMKYGHAGTGTADKVLNLTGNPGEKTITQ